MLKRLVLAVMALAAMALMPMTAQAGAASASCDRRCLLQVLTDYTEALTDNKPEAVAAAPTLRVTYNGVVGKLGQNETWGPARRLPYRQAHVDPVTGSAIFYGIVTQSTRPTRSDTPGAATAAANPRWWYYVVRLQVVNRRVTEVEEIAYERPPNGFGADPSTLTFPDRTIDDVLPVSERSTKAQMKAAGEAYFDAVSQRIDYRKVPWHPECQRVELGVFTVNAPRTTGSCGGEFQTPSQKWNVENRRYYIYDVERGIVIAVGNFMTPPEYPNNNGSVVFELFKIQDGMIRYIFAFFRGNGQARSGWGTGPGS